MNRDELKSVLVENICQVAFTKVDGSERVMKCTLKPELLPEQVSKSEKKRTEILEVLPVFDLEKNGWRSFRIDSVKSVDVIE